MHTPQQTGGGRRVAAALATLIAIPAGASAAAASDSGLHGPVDAGIFVQKVEGLLARLRRTASTCRPCSRSRRRASSSGTRPATPADLFDVLADAGVNTRAGTRVERPVRSPKATATAAATSCRARGRDRTAGDRGRAQACSSTSTTRTSGPTPRKQLAPKAWVDLADAESAVAARDFTARRLSEMQDAGVDVRMVQTGNETNNGVAGVTAWPAWPRSSRRGRRSARRCSPMRSSPCTSRTPRRGLLRALARIRDNSGGLRRVREFLLPVLARHAREPHEVLTAIADTYGKKVMVAETSWAQTLEDADGLPNVIGPPLSAPNTRSRCRARRRRA